MNKQQGGGIGCFTLLGLLFIALKLTGYIDWSWLWILAPFWIPFMLATTVLAFVAVTAILSKE